ncbi:MAG: glycosyltransferase family 4 protein [Candidatus Thorarchaeota archaeon]|nr:MAG: glycosyltransferase family 4 protein [Candidatus Thorarchaeota archaeon]
MRIGLISKFGSADGLCVRAAHVLKGLVDHGHDVHVFTQSDSIDSLPEDRIHRFRAVPVNPHFYLDSPGAVRLIAEKSKEHNIDLLHVQMNSSSTEFLLPFYKHALPPIVTTFHLAYAAGSSVVATAFAIAWKASMFAAKRYDHIILVDPSQQQVMDEYGISEDKTSVIINGVDTDLFCPGEGRNKNGWIDFVYVGRLAIDKGVHILLDAFKEFHAEYRKSRLTLVGDGLLKAMVDDCVDDGSVRWLGVLDHQRVPEVLQNADVFVIPQNIGGLGLSVIEAMSCGVPVITTAIGETRRLLGPDEGVLVQPDSSSAVLNAMRHLADEDLRREMGERCRMKILKNYSWESQMELLEETYRKVMKLT